MQNYCCNHCGLSSKTTLELFLHIFTDHLHKDIGLDREEVPDLLAKMWRFMVTKYAFGVN